MGLPSQIWHTQLEQFNKYLAWAFIEAANFAIRNNAQARRFYEQKKVRTTNFA